MDTNNQLLERFSSLAFLILTGLADGPKQLPVLKASIEQNSGYRVEPGTFWKALTRLERRGWITALNNDAVHTYALTESGEMVLERHYTTLRERRDRIGFPTPGIFLKEKKMKLLTCLVKLYPRAWRERYETEMLALLEQHTITFWTVIDLLFGIIDARLDPYYRSGQSLFSLKSLRTASIVFLAALTLAFYCISSWQTQASNLLSPSDGVSNISYLVTRNSNFYGLILLLFASGISFVILSIKRAIATRQKGTLLLATACFAIPFVTLGMLIFQALHLDIRIAYPYVSAYIIGIIRGDFLVFGGLLLIMGCLFLTIIRAKEAFTTHKKKLLFLIGLIDLLLIVLGYYLYQVISAGGPPLVDATTFFVQIGGLAMFLFPYAGIGLLLLSIVNSTMSKRMLRIALIPATGITLAMIVNLLASLTWEIIHWSQKVQVMNFSFLFAERFSIIPLLGLATAVIFAITALRYGFMSLFATPTAVEESLPPLQQQMQKK